MVFGTADSLGFSVGRVAPYWDRSAAEAVMMKPFGQLMVQACLYRGAQDTPPISLQNFAIFEPSRCHILPVAPRNNEIKSCFVRAVL